MMMFFNVIVSILAIVGVVSLFIIFVDLYYNYRERYIRFRIGKWKSEELWLNSVKRVARRWAFRLPVVEVHDNSRLILIDIISGKYRNPTYQLWQVAGILLGLLEDNNEASRIAMKNRFNNLIDKNGRWKEPPQAVNCGILAYAALKAADHAAVIKPAMDFAISVIDAHLCEDGMICYTQKDPENRYVDTLGFICPFLTLYANIYNKPQYELLAYYQIANYRKYGLQDKTMLPNHAYNSKNKMPLGLYGWGRGLGWYLLALIDTYLEMELIENKQELKEHIRSMAENLIIYQNADGGFGSIIQLDSTYDSSATAILSYYYSKCFDLFGIDRYLDITNKCLNKLKSVTRFNGEIDWCQGDTKGIGVHSQTFSTMPFVQGMVLRAASPNNSISHPKKGNL